MNLAQWEIDPCQTKATTPEIIFVNNSFCLLIFQNFAVVLFFLLIFFPLNTFLNYMSFLCLTKKKFFDGNLFVLVLTLEWKKLSFVFF